VFASSFAATLEMVREGQAELHQHAAFAPIYVRKRQGGVQDGVQSVGVEAEPGNE
jgi:segregation and condensation protein A